MTNSRKLKFLCLLLPVDKCYFYPSSLSFLINVRAQLDW